MRFKKPASKLILLLGLLPIILACQPSEPSTPATVIDDTSAATLTTSSSLVPIPTTTVTVTPIATLVPSTTPFPTSATPFPEEWLAFLKQSSEYWDNQTLFFARSDGNVVTQPEFFESYQRLPGLFFTWSPNGRFIQFDGGEQDPRLYMFDSVEGTISGISPSPVVSLAYLGRSSWSPDSHHFVTALPVELLLQGEDAKGFNLFIYTVNTQEYARLTTNPYSDSYPTWSPDGQWIAFFRYTEDERGCGPFFPSRVPGCNQTELYIIRPDGTDQMRLLESAYLVHDDTGIFDLPHNTSSWSRDSQWLAVLTGDEQPDITLVNIESGETHVLAANPALDINPTWSPDGSRLAFVSDREGNREIYLISPDGTGMVNLTNDPAFDYSPVWSPSGRYIAFLSNREGTLALYVMNADGSNPTKIGDGSVISRPAWFPLTGIDLQEFFGSGNK
ncbi:MAG: hypothetical protein L0287_12990 [Anaerolineae bacterium]|nr:hypothetical protein [Anaerolineae bacterium]MCI0610953.1 hypothetical protein [Anaerolineae bacterium]